MTGYYTYMDNKGGYNNAGKVVEVLAPAGSLDICKAVINAGADAVYLGKNSWHILHKPWRICCH